MISWAISNQTNKLVHIHELLMNNSYDVSCIECHSKLIAKRGKQNVWHFAHKSTSSCQGGTETIIHQLAKEIISKKEFFSLPLKIVTYTDENYSISEYLVQEDTKIQIDECLCEKYFQNIQPDIQIISRDKPLFIEIAVTHFIDEEKLDKIKKMNISCIEIDLSHLKNEIFDYKTLVKEIDKHHNVKWIYHRKEKEKLLELKRKVEEQKKQDKLKEEKENKQILENICNAISLDLYDINFINSYIRKEFFLSSFELIIKNQFEKEIISLELEIDFYPVDDDISLMSSWQHDGVNSEFGNIPSYYIDKIVQRYLPEFTNELNNSLKE